MSYNVPPPYGQNPYGHNRYGQNSYSQQRYYGQQQYYGQSHPPYGQNPYRQHYGEPPVSPRFASNDMFAECPEGKSRGVTALLALLAGCWGVHYFYCNKPVGGIIMIVIWFFSLGLSGIFALIQAILLFSMSNFEFRQRYVLSNNAIPF